MSKLNEDLILEYLVENINQNLSKNFSVKDVLMLDYCYKKNDSISKDFFSGFVSKVINKQLNNASKPINLNGENLVDCLFLESYKNLLSNKTKNLIKNARTAQDFKAIIAIDVLSDKINNPDKILISPYSLDSKIFNLTREYEESNFEDVMKKEYMKIREYFLKVDDDLKNPLNRDLVKKFNQIRNELNEKFKAYSRYSDRGIVFEIQSLITDINKAIDSKLNSHVQNIDQRYSKVKRVFEDGVWDSEKRINKLISLRSEIKDIQSKYQLVFHKEGVRRCDSLDCKIKELIENYNYVKDVCEEFKAVERKISDYYGEVDSIFREDINFSSVRKLNRIYSNLRKLSNKKFPDYVAGNWQENYYSNLGKTKDFIKRKCVNRVDYLLNQSSKYRKKISNSFFSWQTRKSAEKLENYNNELEAWSICQVV